MNTGSRAGSASTAKAAGLPVVLTTFVGRAQEMADVRRLLTSSRLVTLTGPAGCGKTRLALQYASEVAGDVTDGVYWVELASLAEPELVPQAVARSLDIVEEPGRSPLDALAEVLAERHVLLVLDNCEHLVPACRELAERLVALSGVNILATSREPLGVLGEQRYLVPPLALPPRRRWSTRSVCTVPLPC
jgi:predicted ATPase